MDRVQKYHLITTETQESAPSMGATYIVDAQSKLPPLLLKLVLMAILLDSVANVG
jgi:hypothetical protein